MTIIRAPVKPLPAFRLRAAMEHAMYKEPLEDIPPDSSPATLQFVPRAQKNRIPIKLEVILRVHPASAHGQTTSNVVSCLGGSSLFTLSETTIPLRNRSLDRAGHHRRKSRPGLNHDAGILWLLSNQMQTNRHPAIAPVRLHIFRRYWHPRSRIIRIRTLQHFQILRRRRKLIQFIHLQQLNPQRHERLHPILGEQQRRDIPALLVPHLHPVNTYRWILQCCPAKHRNVTRLAPYPKSAAIIQRLDLPLPLFASTVSLLVSSSSTQLVVSSLISMSHQVSRGGWIASGDFTLQLLSRPISPHQPKPGPSRQAPNHVQNRDSSNPHSHRSQDSSA